MTNGEALDGKHGLSFTYLLAKTLAEKTIWEFADAHPDVDVTTSEHQKI